MSIIVSFVCADPTDIPIICAKSGLISKGLEALKILLFLKTSILVDTVGQETLRYSAKAAFEICG
ncbi:hypothetical protein JCM18507_11890 [Fusicatenibacter saccharivorans]